MKYPTSHLKYIFQLIFKFKKEAIYAAILMVIANLTRIIEPYFYKIIVDTLTTSTSAPEGFSPQSLQLLLTVIIVWAIFALIANTTGAQQNYLIWQFANRSSQVVHLEGYQRLLKLDYQKHKDSHSSRLCKIIDDADVSTWEMMNWWMNRIIPACLSFVGIMILALSVSWEMTLIALIVVPIDVAIIIRTLVKSSDAQHKINKLWQKKHEHMSDQITNISTFKLNPDEKLFLSRQKVASDAALNAQLKLNKTWRWLEMLKLDVLARFLVMGAGIWFVSSGKITLGTLFMFLGMLGEIFIPIHVMGDILPQYSRRARYIEKFLQLMNQKDTVSDPAKPILVQEINGKIEFKKVSFGYDSPILKEISFTINPGEKVAIVGHSGAGKTTLMSLITRLMDVSDGKILIDGHDIRDYNKEDLMRHIGTVLQENSMYDDTIAQNIGYGRADATRDEIIESAQMASADEFITKLPQGYDTLIGEKGVRLSGGEKQRIAIARAILKKPKIVILDEPTSALDSITEARVQKGLEALVEGRTSIIIAHRLATVRNCDKIVVIENGKIIGCGTHLELLKSCPVYREMVDLQTGGFLAE